MTDSTVRSSKPWNEFAPDWKGSGGKPTEFLMADGSVQPGEFYLDDTWFTGEETIPIWHVEWENGERISFYDDSIKGWRARK